MLRFARMVVTSVLAGAVAACAHGRAPAPLPRTDPIPRSAALALRLAPAARVLDSAIAAGAAPGGVVAVSYQGLRFVHSAGQLAVDDPRPPDGRTLYDMASLTKVVVATTLAMYAIEEGKLSLDSTVVHYLPDFATGAGQKTRVTVRNLLLHNAGLPSGPSPGLWLSTKTRPEAIARALVNKLDTVPGARMVYSDLSAITLTALLERVYGKRLDVLFAEKVTRPLGLSRMLFRPPPSWGDEIAPTEIEVFRGPTAIRGEVHDENAWRLDGVSGHAGLFSGAEDLLRFGEWALAGATNKRFEGSLQPPRSFAPWTVRQDQPPGSSRAIGWDTPGNAAGSLISASGFGHTGFTGTSIWIDKEREIVIVLLTNRVNPSRTTPRFGQIRAVIGDAVIRSLFPDAVPRARR
jgi:CubicO group peptidase (beta-lactamase class C family)